MNINSQESRWTRMQRGQALAEYGATIPAAILITIAAGIIATFVGSSLLKAVNGLDGYCASESQPVSTTAMIYDHTIESSGYSYDPNTNLTTVSFTVTSGTQPSISHWVLGVPKEVADHVTQTSESWTWTDSDPTTGARGMKFDIGYESTGDSVGSNNGNGNNGGGKGNGKAKLMSHTEFSTLASDTSGLEIRVITVELEGIYQFANLTVTVKAGNDEIGTGTVSGPVALDNSNPASDEASNEGKGC